MTNPGWLRRMKLVDTSAATTPRAWRSRLLWLLWIWLLSVCLLGAVGLLLRLLLRS